MCFPLHIKKYLKQSTHFSTFVILRVIAQCNLAQMDCSNIGDLLNSPSSNALLDIPEKDHCCIKILLYEVLLFGSYQSSVQIFCLLTSAFSAFSKALDYSFITINMTHITLHLFWDHIL